MKDLKYLFAYLIPISGFISIYYAGLYSYSTVLLTFFLLPVIDAIWPASNENLEATKEQNKSSKLFFDALLFICIPLCYIILFFYLDTICHNELELFEKIGITLSTGIVLGAVGINVSHELGHRTHAWSRFFAKAGLLIVLYPHFYIEHNRGHHKNVATDEDPASAKKNENLYAFIFKSILGQYLHAWKLENTYLIQNNKKVFSLQNEMIRYVCSKIIYLSIVLYFFGWYGIVFIGLVALLAICLLESINYIEHYGLRRNILPSGLYERVLPKHSWNSNHEMGRIFLFELTRHSDHHFKSERKYQILRHLADSPQLPVGYPASILLSLIPPLWFRIMNRRLETEKSNL